MGSMGFGMILSCLLFAVPLGLVYNFFYYKRSGYLPNILLFFIVYLLGYTVTLMFYRIAIKNDATAQIDKINSNKALTIMGTSLASFMILALTMFSLGVAPSLVSIFENTFGYWFIGLWGLSDLANSIFSSPTMDAIKDKTNPRDFNYNFLVTRINIKNLQDFITYGQTCNQRAAATGTASAQSLLPLDFDLRFTDQGQVDKLTNLVYLKNAFGHYMWVYLTSIISLMISMITVIISSGP